MNAVARVARDVGPVRELCITVEAMGRTVEATARYVVSYPSLWHSANGIDPDVTVVSVTYEDGAERKWLTITRALRDAIAVQVEANELELN